MVLVCRSGAEVHVNSAARSGCLVRLLPAVWHDRGGWSTHKLRRLREGHRVAGDWCMQGVK